MLNIGQEAPDFEKEAHSGENIRLSQYKGSKAVVLYFYPKDETPGCTVEACSFRDSYEDFVNAGAVVIGVSQDSNDAHRSFAQNHRLPFLLVSDKDKALQQAYGVPKTLGLLPGRATFVINTDGKIAHVFNSQFRAKKHVEEALGVLRANA